MAEARNIGHASTVERRPIVWYTWLWAVSFVMWVWYGILWGFKRGNVWESNRKRNTRVFVLFYLKYSLISLRHDMICESWEHMCVGKWVESLTQYLTKMGTNTSFGIDSASRFLMFCTSGYPKFRMWHNRAAHTKGWLTLYKVDTESLVKWDRIKESWYHIFTD